VVLHILVEAYLTILQWNIP